MKTVYLVVSNGNPIAVCSDEKSADKYALWYGDCNVNEFPILSKEDVESNIDEIEKEMESNIDEIK